MLNGLKIALGYEIKNGPWGGGNLFLRSFKEHFEGKGALCVSSLKDSPDIVMIINPRSGTLSLREIQRYKKKNPKVIIIHRINETDKAKNTRVIEKLRFKANRVSDAVVFVSEWVRDYYIKQGFNAHFPNTVIKNGADESIFNSFGYTPWSPQEPMSVITHHWSDNRMKGIDIYEYFDNLLNDHWMRKRFEFTYIGKLPAGSTLKNTKYIPPLHGESLAQELKKHHVYLTAARWEACPMHPLEGASCGLPVLYIDEGGGTMECCEGFGIQFSKDTFAVGLFKMLQQYFELQPKMKDFPLKASAMTRGYEEFIVEVLKKQR